MNILRHKALLLPVTGGLLLALAGCGGAQEAPASTQGTETSSTQVAPAPAPAPGLTVPEASELLPKVAATIKAATSVSLNGDMTRGSETMKIKLSGTRDGSNSLTEVTTKGAQVKLLNVDGGAYMKADKEFFVQNAGKESADLFTKLAGDKWISIKDTSAFGDFNVASLLDGLDDDGLNESELGKPTDKSVVELDGTQAFKYTFEDGSFWIAAQGEPYLLQAEPIDSSGKDSGTLTFSEWNAVAPHSAPAKNETVTVPGL